MRVGRSGLPGRLLPLPCFSAGDVIDEERRRLIELKQRAALQGRVQWEERKLREVNCNSFESEDSSIGSSATSEKETRRVTLKLTRAQRCYRCVVVRMGA